MKSKANVLIIALVIIIIIVAAILIFGNSEEELPVPENGGPNSEETAGSPEVISGIGTVYYVDLEGGFYGILSDDGIQYQPINLATEMQVDGLRVQFSGQVVEDYVGTTMWGTPVEISEASIVADIIPEEPTGEEFPEEELPEEEGEEMFE
jgi:hypothetical protein